ncbi:MAG TPA: hypothetical protein VNT79_15700 [Phycisphaerae bacterium]|nr:hypothetical protein [Phycisphaerae bacterium]
MADGPTQPPSETKVVPAAVQPVVITAHAPPEERGFFATIGRGIAFIFTPITWLARPLVFRVGKDRGNPKVYFTSFSTLIYLWPVMVLGFLGPWLVDHNFVRDVVMGWIWITTLLIVLICMGSDTDRNKTAAIAAVVIILWLIGLLVEAKKGIPVLSNIKAFFESYNVAFDKGTAGVFSIATLIILIFVLGAAWFDGRYEITTREITHKRMFRTSDSLPRAAKRVKRDWRDLIETFLGLGAGDVIVLDTNSNVVLRISNVPFLWFFRHDVDHVLEVLATTEVDDVEAAIAEHADDA